MLCYALQQASGDHRVNIARDDGDAENAGLENSGPPNGAGKRRTGKRETT